MEKYNVELDDYHNDLPQCGYYRIAGKIFLSACSRKEVQHFSLRTARATHSL